MSLTTPDTSSMKTFVRRPIRVEAIRFDGTNADELSVMCADSLRRTGSGVFIDGTYVHPGEWVVAGIDDVTIVPHADFALHYAEERT